VRVLYAGSLTHLMETAVGPAFSAATGYRLQGVAGGSAALAHTIRSGLRTADVFVSASPQVDDGLMGPAHGDWVRWYIPFARAPLVLAYQPRSPFAARLRAPDWHAVLLEPGLRLGGTDPQLDPKGALTLQLLAAMSAYYGEPGLAPTVRQRLQVFPEEELVGRLLAGQLDAAFLYSLEARQAGVPYVLPPPAVDPEAVYTVTVLRGAPDPAGAVAFVRFLLGPRGRTLLEDAGLTPLPAAVRGDAGALPAALRQDLAPR
jgi:molybdate/tungstate transport system substrate-binding protein